MKKLLIVPVAMIAAVLCFGTASANPPKGPMGPGPRMMQGLSPEKHAEMGKILNEYAPKMAEVRDLLKVKKMEFDAIADNPNAQVKDISTVAREMDKLMADRRALQQERHKKLEAVAGHPLPMGFEGLHPCHGPRADMLPGHGPQHHRKGHKHHKGQRPLQEPDFQQPMQPEDKPL